jgi:asparagine synthase (glutamine-hydrolysing)
MCGINAILDFEHKLPDKEERVRIMNSSMVYRGPDGEGQYNDESIAIGMRRLSIIDVAGGDQPLFNEDRSLVLVCNGEIYNYVELQQELRSKGHKLSSLSDCEVILHLYEDYGTKCLGKMRGMFGFVLWDVKNQRLFAARGPSGIKPLYYSEQNGVHWFSSELKAIAKASRTPLHLDGTSAWQYLHYSHPIDQRKTMVKEIVRVLPGEYVVLEKEKATWRRYWQPMFGVQAEHPASDAELLETLKYAMKIHLRSDVPLALLLSSGLDSSAIAALTAKTGASCTALCAGYVDDFRDDERTLALEYAQHLRFPTKEIVLDSHEFVSRFRSMMPYCDEPVADPSSVVQWVLYHAGREDGFKVLLSGIGGDEIFFGYIRWNALGYRWQREHEQGTYKRPEDIQDSQASFWRAHWLLNNLSSPAFREFGRDSDQPLHEHMDRITPGPDAIYSVLIQTYLVNNGLLLADKLGMGSSVEVRVPFADSVLVETVLGLPLERRFSPTQSKVLAKRILANDLPAYVLTRPKKGFSVPTRYLSDLAFKHKDEICDGFIASNWLDKDAVTRLLPRKYRDGSFGERLSMAIGRRSFNVLSEVGVRRAAMPFAHVVSAEFLYRILVFEEWLDLIESETGLMLSNAIAR